MEPSSQTETHALVGHIFRRQAVEILARLTRVFGPRHLDLAEDVLQDTLIKALQQWPFRGVPENPAAWLMVVARNRALDLLRRDAVLCHKVAELEGVLGCQSSTVTSKQGIDDELALILMCCHPLLTLEGQVTLTLKLACGFSTTEISRAFLTSESTVAQRLARAKRQIREKKIALELPEDPELASRLASVLRVLYLVFNEGYAATSGNALVRDDLCGEAIRLGTLLLQNDRLQQPAVHALLALMMLQAARLRARINDNGTLALLKSQDRTSWDQRLIAGGLRHLGLSANGDVITTYHLQAEIAAIHATAPSDAETDWASIAIRYDELYSIEPTPIVALNRAIARSRWRGPRAGIEALEEIESHPRLQRYHLLPAVSAELWKQVGDFRRAAEAYRAALDCLLTTPERRFLEGQLEQLPQ